MSWSSPANGVSFNEGGSVLQAGLILEFEADIEWLQNLIT